MAALASGIKVFYWPMYGRAGAALRMLEYRNIPFTLTTDFPSLATVSSSFGAVGDTFAPPIVVDGDKTYSQSTAVCLWAGRKCGLDEGVDDIKAMQYLADMVDVFENGVFVEKGKGSEALKTFIEGGRFAKLMSNIERGIKGPFWFGEKVSFVDFFAANAKLTMNEYLFDRLKSEFGVDVFAAYPKFNAVCAAVSDFDSWKAGSAKMGTFDAQYCCKDESFAAWKK
jgi:hypothetical protein